ncbi:S41 family peptidase [Peptococcaceae bacterium]|nr:S41 family peptidase [Peptococcaceae bacterium]
MAGKILADQLAFVSKIKFKVQVLLIFLLLLSFVFTHPFSAFAEATEDQTQLKSDLLLLEEVIDNITEYHINKPKTCDLIDSAINGMLDSLNDPHAGYIPPELFKEYLNLLDNRYTGIGIEIRMEEEQPVITRIFDNSPAKLAGLEVGDIIIKVDGENTHALPLEIVSAKIRGEENTTVVLTIKRNDEIIEVPVVRKFLKIPTVYSKLINGNIAYVKIKSFNQDTPDEFMEHFTKLSEHSFESMILDLRENAGGYLTAAVEIADYFLPAGKKIVDFIKNSGEKMEFYSENHPSIVGLKLAVLVDENTASAAEILAGILQHYDLALLVGEETYGKGTVQTIINLKNGGGLKFTIAEYKLAGYMPIEGIGLTPNKNITFEELQIFAAKNILDPPKKYEFCFNINQNSVIINDLSVKIPSIIQKEGKTYIPLRFVAEMFGSDIEYNKQKSIIEITNSDGQILIDLKSKNSNYDIFLQTGITYINIHEIEKIAEQLKINVNFKLDTY